MDNMKTLEYKGRVVFKKLSIPKFKRIPTESYENEACFIFVTQGEYQVRSPTQLIEVNVDQGLLAKCMNYFYENSQDPQIQQDNGEVLGVFLYPEIFQQLFNFDISQSNHSVPYNLKQVALDQLLIHYRDSVNILLDSPELADEILIENKLREFVILMAKKVSAPSELDFLASMFKPNFSKFEEVIEKNLYADLALAELAALCHMSLSTFKRKFKEVYGESPIKYITKLKIDKAQVLLKNKALRISDIAHDSGFESISAFNRAFKAHTQLSPSQYRLD